MTRGAAIDMQWKMTWSHIQRLQKDWEERWNDTWWC